MITAILVFLWLVCSSAWAKGLQNVKDATGTEGISSTLALCKASNITCEVTDYANLRTLNISVVRRSAERNLMQLLAKLFIILGIFKGSTPFLASLAFLHNVQHTQLSGLKLYIYQGPSNISN